MATTPNYGFTVVDSSPSKAHDLLPQFRDFQFEVDAALAGPTVITSGLPWITNNLLVGETVGLKYLNSGYDAASDTGYIRSVHTDSEFKNLKVMGKDVSFYAALGAADAQELLRVSVESSGFGNIYAFAALTQFANTAFYPASGASVNRFDRVLMGGAMYSDAAFPNVTKDWMEDYGSVSINGGPGITQNGGSAQVSILTHKDNYASAMGLFVGAQNKWQTIGSTTVYAIGAVAVNNNTDAGINSPIWVGYFEGHQVTPEAGSVSALELEVRASGVDTVYLDPYNSFHAKQVQGLQLAAGCGLSATGQFNATTGILFFNNPMKWKAGILFHKDSLSASGPGSTYSAIQFAQDHRLQWFNPDGSIGTPSTVGASLWSTMVTSQLTGGTGFYSGSLGANLRMQAKGVAILSHASVGLLAEVDQQVGGASSITTLVVKEILGTTAAPHNFGAVDSATGFTIGKRDNIHSWLQTCSSTDVGPTNEVAGIRSLVTESSTGDHTGKFYGGSLEMDSQGSGRHAFIRGGFALLAKGGTGTVGDGKAFYAQFNTYPGSSGLMDLIDVGLFGFELHGPSTFTTAHALRGILNVSEDMTCTEFRTIRASPPNVIGSPTLVITKMTGVSIGDHSGITGVTTSYNLASEGINSQNYFEGLLVLGGPNLLTDTAPGLGLLQGQSAWAGATTNVTGGDIALSGGIGRRLYTVVSIVLGDVTVTTTVNGSAVALVGGVSGSGFLFGATTTTAATNLAAAINANGTLNTKVLASSSGAIVYLRKKGPLHTLTIATNQAGRVSTTSDTDGVIEIKGTAPILTLRDTTPSAKSLTLKVDSNLAYIRESATADGTLMVLDLTNGRLGINTIPGHPLDVFGAGRFQNNSSDTTYLNSAGQVNFSMVNINGTTNNWMGFHFQDNAGAVTCDISAQTTSHTNHYGKLVLGTRNAADGYVPRITIEAGVQIGSPTGGDKGAGSINAVTVWRNGTALDYVFEDEYKMKTIDEMSVYFRKHKHLPTIPTREVHDNGSTDMGSLTDRLWETVEVQARYITELHERLSKLEN